MCSQERGNDDVITQMYWLAISVENFQRIYPCGADAVRRMPDEVDPHKTRKEITIRVISPKWMTRLLKKKKKKKNEILLCIF